MGVEVAAFGRVPAAPVALRTGEEEVVDGRADDVAALRAQDDGELVGQRGLAGGGRPVDGDPQRVRGRDGRDRLGQPTDELVAGAWSLAASVTMSLYSTGRRQRSPTTLQPPCPPRLVRSGTADRADNQNTPSELDVGVPFQAQSSN